MIGISPERLLKYFMYSRTGFQAGGESKLKHGLIVAVMVLAMVLFTAGVAWAETSAGVSVASDKTSADPSANEQFTISVFVHYVEDLYGISFNLVFNPSVIKVVHQDDTPDSGAGAVSSGGLFTGHAYAQPVNSFSNIGEQGRVYFAELLTGDVDGIHITQPSLVASVTFQAVDPGTVALRFAEYNAGLGDLGLDDSKPTVLIQASDSSGQPIEYNIPVTDINVGIGIPDVTLTVSPESLALVGGDSQSITVIVDPEDADVSFVSGDTGIATVNSGGLVTAVSPGSTAITVTASKEGYTSAEKTVPVEVTAVPDITLTVSPESLALVEGDSQSIAATVDPEDADVSFVCGDTGIATVNSDGLVTAVSPGSTAITVTARKEGHTSAVQTVPVTVSAVTIPTPGDPTAPTNLLVTDRCTSSIRLAWDAPSGDLLEYVVEMKRDGEEFATVGVTTTTSFRKTRLSSGTTYTFRVRAEDGEGGVSAWSVVSATTRTVSRGRGVSDPLKRPLVTEVSGDIDAETGGSLSFDEITVEVPPAVLPEDATITVIKLSLSDANMFVSEGLRLKLANQVYEITASGSRDCGDKYIFIKILYDKSQIPRGAAPVLHRYDDVLDRWVKINSIVTQENGKWYVVVQVNHL